MVWRKLQGKSQRTEELSWCFYLFGLSRKENSEIEQLIGLSLSVFEIKTRLTTIFLNVYAFKTWFVKSSSL